MAAYVPYSSRLERRNRTTPSRIAEFESMARDMKDWPDLIKKELAMNDHEATREIQLFITGYDTSLPKKIVERALFDHTSVCGKLVSLVVPVDYNNVAVLENVGLISVRGEGAFDKAQKLNDGVCGCAVEGCKLLVVKIRPCSSKESEQIPFRPSPYLRNPRMARHVMEMAEKDLEKAVENAKAKAAVKAVKKAEAEKGLGVGSSGRLY